MIRRLGLRWQLVMWVSGVLLAVSAIVFVFVYEQTGSQLRSRVATDVTGDVRQLTDTVRTLRASSSSQLLARLRSYVSGQPYSGNSPLLFAAIPGRPTVSNHPELFGSERPDDGESSAEQQHENALGRAVLAGPGGPRTRWFPTSARCASTSGWSPPRAFRSALAPANRWPASPARSAASRGRF